MAHAIALATATALITASASRGSPGAGRHLGVNDGAPTDGADGAQRPVDVGPRDVACAVDEAVCVHRGDEVSETDARIALVRLAEIAKRGRTALQLLGPRSDGVLGGDRSFDVYLRAGAPNHAFADPDLCHRFDSASAFGLVDPVDHGCRLDRALAQAWSEAVLLGLDPREPSTYRWTTAAYLAQLLAPCDALTAELVDDAQRAPERAVISPSAGGDRGGPLFAWYVDRALGAGPPGSVPLALTAVSTQHATGTRSPTGSNEPDAFDALSQTLKNRKPPRSLSDLLLDFAISRAFMGDRDDGLHLLGERWTGRFGRVRFDWSIPFASLPRTLTPARPIEPTGSCYIWLNLEGVSPGAHLDLRATWEPPVLFRWSVVRIGPHGEELSRVEIVGQNGIFEAERRIEQLDGVKGLLVVGVNAGGAGAAHPFDPDDVPFEPHSYAVTLRSDTD